MNLSSSCIALIPLDDRPCNTRFPVEIARIVGCELLLPPRALLGWFTQPALCEEIAEWLQSLALPLDALIISVDMLSYGGLIASRTTETSLDTAQARLAVLREWRDAHPQVPVYAFNVIRRLAPTLDRDEMISFHTLLQQFAILKDQVARVDDPHLAVELERVESELPADLLKDYLAGRERNHAVNVEMLHWLAEGAFDFLLLPQEDCAEFGLHRAEQAALKRTVSSLRVADRVAIHSGADEAALTLLARHWNRTATRPTTFHVIYSDAEDAQHIPPFEDRPLCESVTQHIVAAGGMEAEESAADVLLFVNAPAPFPRAALTEGVRAQCRLTLRPFMERIAEALNSQRHAATADVAFPNGADPVFVDLLRECVPLHRLLSFAAWNTAGNTLGTVLAQCTAMELVVRHGVKRSAAVELVVRHAAQRSAVTDDGTPFHSVPDYQLLNAQFLFARLLDDWGYQAIVRPEVERRAREEFQASPLRLGNAWKRCEAIVQERLGELARVLFDQHFRDQMVDETQGVALKELHCEVSLPWERTFEVDVDVEFET